MTKKLEAKNYSSLDEYQHYMEKMQAGEDDFCPFRHFYVLNKNRQKTKISFSFSPLTHRRGDSYYIFSKLE